MIRKKVTARMSQVEKSNGAFQSNKVGNYTSVTAVGIVMGSTCILIFIM